MSSPVGEWGGMSVFAGWGWCWLRVVQTKLVDDVVKSGDCWQSWMMTWYVFTGAGCAMSWMTIFWLIGERWLRHWMVGNGVESEYVCGAGWVLVRLVDCVCVCVGGGGGGGEVVDRIGLYWWWLGMCSLGLGVQWVGWLYFDSGGRWLGHWMVGEWGWVRVCVCVWCWLGVG